MTTNVRTKASARRGGGLHSGQNAPTCSLMDGGLTAHAMQTLDRAKEALRYWYPWAHGPLEEFALDRLAVLAVHFNHALAMERSLVRTLSTASIASTRNSLNQLRQYREEIDQEFAKISSALVRRMVERRVYQEARDAKRPLTKASSQTRADAIKTPPTVPQFGHSGMHQHHVI